MHNDRLENLLRHLRREEIPSCPGNLEANVVRRIRLERSRTRQSDPQGFFSAILKPKLGIAALALAIVSSAATTTVAMDFSERTANRSERAEAGIDLLQLELLNHSDDLICCCK